MMNSRRWMMLSLACLLSTAHAEPVTLTFVRLGGELHDSYLNPIIGLFEKSNPDIRIESVTVVSGGYEALAQKVLLSAASGQTPDLAQTGYSFVRTMVERAGAIPLDGLMRKDSLFRKDNLFPAMLSLGKINNKTYAVPLATSTPILYINEDAFLKAGLNPKNPPRSWEQAFSMAQKLKKAGYEGILWDWTITGNWIFQTMTENAQGKLADKKDQPLFGQGGGLAAGQYLERLTREKLMPVVTDDQATTRLFTSGKLGMFIASTAGRVSTENSSKFKVRMAPVPTQTGSSPKLPAGGNGVVITTPDPKRQQAAWKFLRFLTEAQAGQVVAEKTGYTPANRQVIADLKVKKSADLNYQTIIAQAPRVTQWQNWPGDSSGRISQMIRDALQAIVSGQGNAQQVLGSTAEKVRALTQ